MKSNQNIEQSYLLFLFFSYFQICTYIFNNDTLYQTLIFSPVRQLQVSFTLAGTILDLNLALINFLSVESNQTQIFLPLPHIPTPHRYGAS